MSKNKEQKHMLEEGFKVLAEHVKDVVENHDEIPSCISIPYHEGDRWIRLHLDISPVRDADPEQVVIEDVPEGSSAMTVAEFRAIGYLVEWAIFKHKYEDRPEDYSDWELDFSAPHIPDGVYPIYYNGGSQRKDHEIIDGAFVKDGEFVINETIDAIYKLCRPHFSDRDGLPVPDGARLQRYIEKMEWLPERTAFRVKLGS